METRQAGTDKTNRIELEDSQEPERTLETGRTMEGSQEPERTLETGRTMNTRQEINEHRKPEEQ